MRASSVSFNMMIIVGCIMVFAIPIPVLLIFGAVDYNISETEFNALCHVSWIFTHIHVIGYVQYSIGELFSGQDWIYFGYYCFVTQDLEALSDKAQ